MSEDRVEVQAHKNGRNIQHTETWHTDNKEQHIYKEAHRVRNNETPLGARNTGEQRQKGYNLNKNKIGEATLHIKADVGRVAS